MAFSHDGLIKQLISIHALREEGDLHSRRVRRHRHGNFYPRPPRGGRLPLRGRPDDPLAISIHALREEGDKEATT